jgi:hypothetical protein
MSGKGEQSTDVERYYRDIFDIVKTRCLTRREKMRRVMEEYGIPVPSEDVHFEFILEREMMGYQLEQNTRYKKKYPQSDILRDLLNINTKDKALFRLIQFDKAWLFTDTVKKRTLRAQEEGDRTFLRGLGEAIGEEPKIKPLRPSPSKEDSENHQRVIDYAEAFLDSKRANSPDMKLPRRSILDLHDLLLNRTWVPDKLREDGDYFRRFLERNGTILPYKTRKKLEALKKATPLTPWDVYVSQRQKK